MESIHTTCHHPCHIFLGGTWRMQRTSHPTPLVMNFHEKSTSSDQPSEKICLLHWSCFLWSSGFCNLGVKGKNGKCVAQTRYAACKAAKCKMQWPRVQSHKKHQQSIAHLHPWHFPTYHRQLLLSDSWARTAFFGYLIFHAEMWKENHRMDIYISSFAKKIPRIINTFATPKDPNSCAERGEPGLFVCFPWRHVDFFWTIGYTSLLVSTFLAEIFQTVSACCWFQQATPWPPGPSFNL